MLSSLDVQDWLQSNPPKTCDGTTISQPHRLGLGWTKSSEESAQYSHGDFSGLPAFQMPPTPVDLNHGIDKFVPKRADATGSRSPGVEHLIKEAFVAGASLENCHFLTFRNNLNKIFGTVFDLNNPWTVDGAAITDETGSVVPTTFLQMHDDELRNFSEETPFVAWGYNFEAICTGAPYADANSEYGMLVNFKVDRGAEENETKKSKFSVILGAEIDAYDPVEAQSESRDVQSIPPMSSLREIKTFTRPHHPKQWYTTYNFRHPKWWLQSFLAGVPALVLGARDKQGIVHEIHTIKTADLPRISRKHGCRWSAQQALAFGADVLAWIAEICKSEKCVHKHVRFEYVPSTRIISACIIEGGDLPGRINAALLQQQQQQ